MRRALLLHQELGKADPRHNPPSEAEQKEGRKLSGATLLVRSNPFNNPYRPLVDWDVYLFPLNNPSRQG